MSKHLAPYFTLSFFSHNQLLMVRRVSERISPLIFFCRPRGPITPTPNEPLLHRPRVPGEGTRGGISPPAVAFIMLSCHHVIMATTRLGKKDMDIFSPSKSRARKISGISSIIYKVQAQDFRNFFITAPMLHISSPSPMLSPLSFSPAGHWALYFALQISFLIDLGSYLHATSTQRRFLGTPSLPKAGLVWSTTGRTKLPFVCQRHASNPPLCGGSSTSSWTTSGIWASCAPRASGRSRGTSLSPTWPPPPIPGMEKIAFPVFPCQIKDRGVPVDENSSQPSGVSVFPTRRHQLFHSPYLLAHYWPPPHPPTKKTPTIFPDIPKVFFFQEYFTIWKRRGKLIPIFTKMLFCFYDNSNQS